MVRDSSLDEGTRQNDGSHGAAGTVRPGVIDIGSNSIRLVVFDGAPRAPMPIFNEKALCGLGGKLRSTGRLDPDGVAMALDNLARFVTVAHALEVDRLHVVATAAVRDAADGPDFVEAVTRQCGVRVRVLRGDEEARLSALGVVAGWPESNGIMGDLGGGSLELVTVSGGAFSDFATLPLGPLRLSEAAQDGGAVDRIIDEAFGDLPWLGASRGGRFYAVGGAWRALARVHMAQSAYPLHVIDHYTVDTRDLRKTLGLVTQMSPSALDRLADPSSKRLGTLPLAAQLLHRLIEVIAPRHVVFCAQGLREGVLYDALSGPQREQDPLLASSAEIARRFARFGNLGEALWRWSEPLFSTMGEGETGSPALRRAACLLSDVGWTEHPDYRATHAYQRMLTLPVMGLDHPRRAFLALAVYARYAGEPPKELSALARAVGLTKVDASQARAVGHALALGYTVAAGRAAVLGVTALKTSGNKLRLLLPSGSGLYRGDAVQNCLSQLAAAVGLTPSTEFVDRPKRAKARG